MNPKLLGGKQVNETKSNVKGSGLLSCFRNPLCVNAAGNFHNTRINPVKKNSIVTNSCRTKITIWYFEIISLKAFRVLSLTFESITPNRHMLQEFCFAPRKLQNTPMDSSSYRFIETEQSASLENSQMKFPISRTWISGFFQFHDFYAPCLWAGIK